MIFGRSEQTKRISIALPAPNFFFMKRKFNRAELANLVTLIPDAERAVGRELTDTEATIILEKRAEMIFANSFVCDVGRTAGLFFALVGTPTYRFPLYQPTFRTSKSDQFFNLLRGNAARIGWHALVRFPLYYGTGVLAAKLWIAQKSDKAFFGNVLFHPKMLSFTHDLAWRNNIDFKQHSPLVYRTAPGPEPVQWFQEPFEKPTPQEKLPLSAAMDHPQLCWYRWNPANAISRDGAREAIKNGSPFGIGLIGLWYNDFAPLKPCIHVPGVSAQLLPA